MKNNNNLKYKYHNNIIKNLENKKIINRLILDYKKVKFMENLDWMEDIREFKTNVEYTGILVAITYLNEKNEEVIIDNINNYDNFIIKEFMKIIVKDGKIKTKEEIRKNINSCENVLFNKNLKPIFITITYCKDKQPNILFLSLNYLTANYCEFTYKNEYYLITIIPTIKDTKQDCNIKYLTYDKSEYLLDYYKIPFKIEHILINCKKITAYIGVINPDNIDRLFNYFKTQESVEIDNSGSHNIELSIDKNTAILNLKNNISKEEFVNPSKPTINSEEIYKVENGNTIKETGKKQQKQNINTRSYSISK